jgi:hypothetical protein
VKPWKFLALIAFVMAAAYMGGHIDGYMSGFDAGRKYCRVMCGGR